MKRRGPPPVPYAPPLSGYSYGGPPRDWEGSRPHPRRGDCLPLNPRPYKRGRPIHSPKPVRRDFFEFRLQKLIIGEYVAGKLLIFIQLSSFDTLIRFSSLRHGDQNIVLL